MKNQNAVSPMWWEKTVEWLFVVQAHQRFGLALAPLAGNEESGLGDAKVQLQNFHALVEFKREEGNCRDYSELKKYARDKTTPPKKYAEAMFVVAQGKVGAMAGAGAHALVYGIEARASDQSLPALSLKAVQYWTLASENSGSTSAVDTVVKFAHNVTEAQFKDYVEKLVVLRGYNTDRASSGGVSAQVLGVLEGAITVMDLWEYAREHSMLPAPPQRPEPLDSVHTAMPTLGSP